ncbi:hypothetical protein ART_2187 [Arthrobacter sp. PAMC 25486]|uniref:hypothetical protein n=1 Tax=Arthrobacter sp. PAMC 25486 TaxID=1494608 RepID=UPI000535D35F|nr:hypothetical protein [Arthrobacter sp. PAMC 25486]AIY01786.1 hypothetical protein ART_2187 [Arthrobacter sp. PAMC 25486]
MDSQPATVPESLRDASPGAWLKPLIDVQWHDMHAVVPRGFPAYVRIFHPTERDRPLDTKTWHGHDLTAMVDMEQRQVGWSAVAQAFGKQMHALAQFHRLVGPETAKLGPLDAAGWRYSKPEVGNLAQGVLAKVAAHLCEHTTTPERGVTAIWEGWGGLTSSSGYVELSIADGGVQHHFGGGFEAPNAEPGTGLLPAEVVNGEKLELPGRSYFLFNAGASFYTDPAWVDHVPWHHTRQWPQSPSILWPQDQKWVLVSEIDFDSTIVAGSWELISALAQDPDIEALVLREGADLTWDADVPNRSVV